VLRRKTGASPIEASVTIDCSTFLTDTVAKILGDP